MGIREDFNTAMREVNDELAGDTMTWVDAAGTETTLTCFAYDLDTKDTEGLVLDSGGWRVPHRRQLDFHRDVLAEAGVTITPDGHFLDLAGERWDLIEGEPIMTAQAPLQAAHSWVSVRVRKSVELNRSETGSEFTYGD